MLSVGVTDGAAAFRRLCVETVPRLLSNTGYSTAAFRRLCVETLEGRLKLLESSQPPLGGCVLKLDSGIFQTA